MEYTEKFQFKKPAPEDFYNIADFNGNMDIAETELIKRAIKPEAYTAGNFVALTADGNLSDSGKSTNSFLAATTKAMDIGGEAAGAAAQVQEGLSAHRNDMAKHCSLAEKGRLADALTKQDIVVSANQPAVAEGRIWIKVI